MVISEYNSHKIKALSFISIVFVIYIHSPYLEAAGFPVARVVQAFVADFGLALFAVPMFFAISGMLFFNGAKKVSDCYPKIRKRIRTLLVPYIIWNLIFVGWYVVMAITPGVSSFVNSDMLSNLNLSDPLDTLNFLFIEPARFHLWFLRDLMLFVCMSPLIYIAVKKAPWMTLAIVFLATGWIPRCGLCYFVAGGVLSLHYNLETLKRFLSTPVTIVCLSLYLLNALVTVMFGAYPENAFWQYYIKLMSFVAILAVWGGYDLISNFKLINTKLFNPFPGYSFFIYLFHEPAFNIIKKLGLRLLGVHEWALILLYLVNPIIMCAIAIMVAMALQKIMPKTYSILVGGR